MSYPESDYLKFIMYILMIMLFKFVFNFNSQKTMLHL